jgi:glyoxylase-like metal-dependent hydrolase (beta-lactamase superfamily II)
MGGIKDGSVFRLIQSKNGFQPNLMRTKDRGLFGKFKLFVLNGWFMICAGTTVIRISNQSKTRLRRRRSMQIIRNLWQVGGAGFTSEEDAAIFLIRHGREAALIDAGCGRAHQKLVDNIAAALPAGVKIKYLLLTHCHFDHSGGAEAVRLHYGCPIAAHALDAVYLQDGNSEVTAASWYGARMRPLAVDKIFSDAVADFTVGGKKITARHCPGHTPGSVVYTSESQSELILFGQDIHGPLHPSFFSNQSDYHLSLQNLLELKADILCEGHFGVFRGRDQVAGFIRQFL